MANYDEKDGMQNIIYYLASSESAPIEKTISIDSDELQKMVLLHIYYCDMLKIKARTGDVVLSVANWIHSKCYQAENVVTRNWINVPEFESYRLLAQMYAKELIDSVEQSDGSYFVLKEAGSGLCKKYLIAQQNQR